MATTSKSVKSLFTGRKAMPKGTRRGGKPMKDKKKKGSRRGGSRRG